MKAGGIGGSLRPGTILTVALGLGLLGLVALSFINNIGQPTFEPTGLGPLAPDFSVRTLEGGTFSLSAQQGKPVILFFMAYWCGTCVPEARSLTVLHERYKDQGAVIVALDVDPSSSAEALRTFKGWSDNGEYVWAFDGDNAVARAFGVSALDTTIVINRAGEIVYRDFYPTVYEILEEQLLLVL